MSEVVSDNTIIPASKIQFIAVCVTEKIKPRFLQDFLITNIKLNNILIDNNTYVWHSFIEETNLYKIYIANEMTKNIDISPNILSEFYENIDEKITIDLFVLKDFFAVYKYGKLYCFKNIKESTKTDIQNYITQTCKISLDNIYEIDDIRFKELQSSYEIKTKNKDKPNFVKLKKDNLFLYFSAFSFICMVFFIGVLNLFYNKAIQNNDEKIILLKKEFDKLKNKKINHKKISYDLIELFKYIKLEKLYTNKIVYKKHQVQLSLFHKDKSKLLNFSIIYDDKILIENIEFLEKQNLYEMVVKIAI